MTSSNLIASYSCNQPRYKRAVTKAFFILLYSKVCWEGILSQETKTVTVNVDGIIKINVNVTQSQDWYAFTVEDSNKRYLGYRGRIRVTSKGPQRITIYCTHNRYGVSGKHYDGYIKQHWDEIKTYLMG